MPLILTKVRVPQRRKDHLRRERLLDALHRNLHRKLTFVNAPAGFGKTALLVDFASDVDAVVCWYGIAEGDGDAGTFARHLVAAFRERFPAFDTHVGHASPSASPEAWAAELVNAIVRHVGDFTVLVLDDYHLVSDVPEIVALVGALLAHLPERVRLVVASRTADGIPVTRLTLHDDLALIGAGELRFRPAELQALYRLAFRRPLADEDAARIVEWSSGWIAAILLAARTASPDAARPAGAKAQEVYTLLAEEVFARQPVGLQDLLLGAALVDEFDAELCRHLFGNAWDDAWLEELDRRHLFVTRVVSERGTVCRLHPLFRDFLQDRFHRRVPDRARELHRRAADWFVTREDWPAAVHHLMAAGDSEAAADLMDRAALSLYLAGQSSVLAGWWEAVRGRPELLSRVPRLALSRAKAFVDHGSLEAAEPLLEIAEGVLRAQDDRDGIADALLTRAMIARFRGDFARALSFAEEAVERGGDAEGYRALQARRMRGICLGRLGQPETCIRELEAASAGFRRVERPHDLAECLTDLGIARLEHGDLLEAQRAFQEVLRLRRELASPGALASALNNLAYLYHRAGRLPEAWALYEEALPLARSAGSSRVAAGILNGRGDLLLDLEEWDLARAAYEEACRLAEESGERESLPASRDGLFELERLSRHPSEALHKLRDWGLASNAGFESPDYQFRLGGAYLEMGQIALAREALRGCLAAWRAGRATPDRATAAFLLARLEFDAGRRKNALGLLGQALEDGARLGHDRFLVAAGRRAQALLAEAAQAWPHSAQVRSLLGRVEAFGVGRGVPAPESAVPAIPRPPHFELIAFGPGRALRDGEPISSSGWISTRARALFFYLVDRGTARKEDIGLDFWPEFDNERVSSNLHATFWRVRHAVGPEVVIFDGDRYRLAEGVTAWYDVAEFEAHLRRADEDGLSPEARADAWRQAIALYAGEYLTDIFMDWAERRREALKRHYLRALLGLAGWHLERRRGADGRALFERAIECDPYLDEAHAGLMRCLAMSGLTGEAAAHFRAYAAMLQKELGVPPAAKLKQLYEGLGQG